MMKSYHIGYEVDGDNEINDIVYHTCRVFVVRLKHNVRIAVRERVEEEEEGARRE